MYMYLLHAGDDFERIKVGVDMIEDALQLQNQVNVKRRYKETEGDNVAEELLRSMRKVEGEGQESRGVVIISQRLCEVMKNNKESSQTFQDLIMSDVKKPEGDRRFALVWFENDDPATSRDLFREAFSCAFVDHLEQDRLGLVRWERSSYGPMQEAAVGEMLKQWFGPAAHLGDPKMEEEPNIPDVETVRIVHGGAKQVVREIGHELEECLQLEYTIKSRLYNRVSVDKIPDIVLEEVRSIREVDGPKALGVIVWCPRFLAMMRESTCKEEFQDLVLSLDPHRLVHLCYQVNENEVKRDFLALEGKVFLPIHVNAEDGMAEVTDLIKRVQDVLVATLPVLPADESNDCNISSLESNVSNQPARSVVNPFVQCPADGGEGTFANNPPSNDAFQQQDYGELGPGRNLPNQQVGSDFKSLPPEGQRCGSENDVMESANSSPASLQQTAEEITEDPLEPPDHPISDMNYQCRRNLSIKLDPENRTGYDWRDFASHFNMSHEMKLYVKSLKDTSQTAELLNWLMQNKPDVTCGQFKQVARQHQRMDVVRMMKKFNY